MVRVFLDTLYPFVLYYYTKNCGTKKKDEQKFHPARKLIIMETYIDCLVVAQSLS